MPPSNRRGNKTGRRTAASPGASGQPQGERPVLPGIPTEPAKSAARMKTGLFITFEGGEGAGKTTQASRLKERLSGLGLTVHTAREPGATRLGEQIRTWVKRESDTSVTAEALLFAAARAQLVAEFLKPKLRSKSVIILDRFIDSTVAYQGYGRGMNVKEIQAINEIATGGLLPDLTVFLDADPREGLDRVETVPSLFDETLSDLSERRVDDENERRFENEPITFHEKVRQGYRELAKDGGRWCVVRANQPPHRVADAIWKRVRPLLIDRGIDEDLLVRKAGLGDAGEPGFGPGSGKAQENKEASQ